MSGTHQQCDAVCITIIDVSATRQIVLDRREVTSLNRFEDRNLVNLCSRQVPRRIPDRLQSLYQVSETVRHMADDPFVLFEKKDVAECLARPGQTKPALVRRFNDRNKMKG